MAQSYIHSENNGITVLAGNDQNIPDYDKAAAFRMPPKFIRERGWGRRKKRGDMYGAKYMNEEYKAICTVLFELGEEDSSQKKGPNHMYDFLRRKFPELYSLPTENEIRTLISSLMNNKSKTSDEIDDDDNDDDDRDDNQNTSLPKEHIEYIKEEIEKAIDTETLDALKPSHVLEDAKHHFKQNLKIRDNETEKSLRASSRH